MKNSPAFILIFLLLGCISGCRAPGILGGEDNNSYSFALIGDMPYGIEGVDKFQHLVDEINEQEGLEWVLHVGDIKTGGTPCTDEFLKNRFDMFQNFEIPFVLIPGDNEWTDCHRVSAGEFDPLERLSFLRSLFYPTPGRALGGGTMLLETQAAQESYSAYPEHVQWVKEGVVFVGLHIVGSANSTASFAGRTSLHDEEAAARMNAAILWMRDSFELARSNGSPGVFLMIHANPFFDDAANAFSPFLEALEEEVLRFGKPVLMAHGDSHYFRVDKPLMGAQSKRRIENFTRVETFGAGDIHWLRIDVDPSDVNVFSVRQEIVMKNIEAHHKSP